MRIAIAIVLGIAAVVGIVFLLAMCQAAARGDRMMGIGETPEGEKRDDTNDG